MEEAAATEQSLVALRAALLAFYDEHTFALGRQPRLTRRERLMSQAVERLRLKWLAIGALLVVGAVRSKRQGRPVFGDVRPVARQYGQLAGKDPDVARAEMLRIVKQLLPLDARTRRAGERPRPVTRAEFELAADALVRFYVSGRHSDDALLGGSRPPTQRSTRPRRRCWIGCMARLDRPRRSPTRTGSDMSRRTVAMWRRGCAGWITKPISPADCCCSRSSWRGSRPYSCRGGAPTVTSLEGASRQST